jgi:hypothetical protein
MDKSGANKAAMNEINKDRYAPIEFARSSTSTASLSRITGSSNE